MSRFNDRERSTDLIDQANDAAELFLDAALSKRDGFKPEAHPDFDGEHCVEEDCGIAIPEARLKLGRIRCIDCQSRRENLSRRGPEAAPC